MTLRVMVVDEEHDVLENIQKLMASLPCEVVTLDDEREAGLLLQRQKFEAFILGTHISQLHVCELNQRIRASSLNSAAVVVTLTGDKPVTRERILDLWKSLPGAAETAPEPAVAPVARPGEPSAALPSLRWLAWAGLLFLLCALLGWTTGDRVRGPFGKILHPRPGDVFLLRAGGEAALPLASLQEGISFTTPALPGNPVEMWLKRTWWSGWSYRVSVKAANGEKIVLFSNQTVERLPTGWDVNADDRTIEVVDQNGFPRLQVIQQANYDLHLNLVLFDRDKSIVVRDGDLEIKPAASLPDSAYPAPVFQYPSYLHRGERR